MKNMLIYFFIFTGTTVLHFNVQCMENNANIGHIDTLMLLNKAISEGKSILQQRIHDHQFEITDIYSGNNKRQKPFRIKHYCYEDDGSKLSYEVFSMEQQIRATKMFFKSSNPLNKMDCNIDHCTTAVTYYEDGALKVVALFYNKEALITAVNALKINN